jgi:hypothetical protein
MFGTNPNVRKVMRGVQQNFTAIGFSVEDYENESVIHLPHLVSFPSFSKDEQREQVHMLTRDAIRTSGVEGVTYTLRDTNGIEAGNRNWHQFYVEIHVPRDTDDETDG